MNYTYGGSDHDEEPKTEPTLTDRQGQILSLVAEDMNDEQVAQRLQISTETVRSHMKNIRRTLGVNNRAAAVAKALRSGAIE